ncbi:TraG/VirB4 family ATPase [Tenacibaculum agarivorans]|uniref:TraG/VirB4 family ATPase n=1 Tax=Tenacibaculum agarivorans TaxID=1908389 RepID=UPI00094BA4D5|nr:DUF3875 domain-containing protein [Tenacibaculum agarivorans]
MITSEAAYSILNIKGNAILSKNGDISLLYFMQNPEPYSISEKILDDRLAAFSVALRNAMPEDSYFLKQDICIEKRYNPNFHYYDDSYLSQAQKHHLNNRFYTDHTCVLVFTISNLRSLETAYQSKPLSYKEALEKNDKERFYAFHQSVTSGIGVLNGLKETLVSEMQENEVRFYVDRFVNGFAEEGALVDLSFTEHSFVGSKKYEFFALSDGSYFPEEYSNVVKDTSLRRRNVTLKRGFMDDLGVYFPYNHIYNQLLYFEGNKRLRDELEQRKSKFGKHQKYSGSILRTFKRLSEYQENVIEGDLTLVKSHFNVMLFHEDKERLLEAKRKLRDIFSNKDMTYYSPSFEGAENLFIGSIPGRASLLSKSYFFLSDLETSLGLFTNYSDFKDDQEGIVLFDRIHNKPFLRDTVGRSRTGGHAKNFCIVAPTEGGKSSLAQDLVNQHLQNNTKIVYVEFGESAANLTKLYPEQSVQIKFTSNTPLGINPFDIDPNTIEPSQLVSLNQIILKYWRLNMDARKDSNLNSAIVKLISDYYENYSGEDYSFPSFYNYVKQHYVDIAARREIPKGSFDLESFLNVCVHFLPGEMYANICAPNPEIEGSIKEKDLIVFELTEIKEDPFMISLIYTILQDTVNEKIIKDRNIRGGLIYDEYGETVMIQDDYTGEAIHPTVAYGFQKFRKSNAFIGIILQTTKQLPPDQYTKGIISNTQLLYVLPSTNVVYNAIAEDFEITDQEHIDLMRSIENNFTGALPRYSEVFIRFLEKYAVVGRLEFSKQKLYAFQTDGADWQYLTDDYKVTKDMPSSINNLMNYKNEKTDFVFVPTH